LHDEDGDALYDTEIVTINRSAIGPRVAEDLFCENPFRGSPPLPVTDAELRRLLLAASDPGPRRSPLSGNEMQAATNAAIAAIAGTTPAVATPAVAPLPTASGTSSGEQGTRKRKASPTNTSRKAKKDKADVTRVKVGGRCKCTRKVLFHLLSTETQRACIREFPNNHQCYGTIKSGSSNTGYNVVFDILPSDEKEVFVKRANLDPVRKGAEEPTYSRATDDPAHMATIKKKKERTPLQQSYDAFKALEDDVASVAKTACHQC
jgi:hypothetical protein